MFAMTSASRMIGAWTLQDAARVLRRPTAADDKYSRGVLGVRTGSDAYPGAAVLGVEAAWRTGLGMVRYLGPAVPTSLVLQRRPETVTVDGRVQAWLIGSGTDAATPSRCRDRRPPRHPVVVACRSSSMRARSISPRTAAAPAVVTPHDREHARLREILGLPETSTRRRMPSARHPRLETAAAARRDRRAEGLRHRRRRARRLGRPPSRRERRGSRPPGPAMCSPARSARSSPVPRPARRRATTSARSRRPASWLHGRAASLAAGDLGAAGGPITAVDVAAALPRAVAEALAAS